MSGTAMPMLIAEIGMNYRENPDKSLDWIPILARAGVDAITFQVREDAFYDGTAPWRRKVPDSFYSRASALSHEHRLLFGLALAEPTRVESLSSCGVDFWKTLSWHLPNDDIQKRLAATSKRVFASTGVSSLDQITQCASRFPAVEFIHTQLNLDVGGVNLKAIETIRTATGRKVAFGLHCRDHEVLTLALAFQPSALFFYVRDSGQGDYPDRDHALTLETIPAHVERFRRLAPAVGDGRKETASMPKDGKL